MYTTMTSAAMALLAFASLGRAGTASVTNNCGYPVYLWSVANTVGSMQTISSGGGWSAPYGTNPNGGGYSIKISNTTSSNTVTQLEYTVTGEELYYDVSNINGYPFSTGGVSLEPSKSSCKSVNCPAGEAVCSGVYNNPDDNEATIGCTSDCSLTLTLCAGGSKRSVDVEANVEKRNEPHSHGHRRHPRDIRV